MLTCKKTALTRLASFWEVLSMWSEVFWAGGQGIFARIFLICCFQKTFFKLPQLTCLMVIVSINLRGVQPMGQLVHLNIRFRSDFYLNVLNLNLTTYYLLSVFQSALQIRCCKWPGKAHTSFSFVFPKWVIFWHSYWKTPIDIIGMWNLSFLL